jgi:hypothetical protein
MNRVSLYLPIILLTCRADFAFAQADFRYQVFDETKTDHMNFEFGQDLVIYDDGELKGCPNQGRVSFTNQYRIFGVAQPSFSYAE